MKRKLTTVYALFWALLTACFFSSWFFNPPPGNYTGSPGANTCSSSQGGCHSCGTCGTGSVSISGLPANITPNTPYSITVTVTRTNSVPKLGGFQMVVLDGNNNNVGTLSNPGSSSSLDNTSVPGFVFFEHEPAQTIPLTNFVTYTVTWTSPASAVNPIKIYAAANLANDDNGMDGDRITLTNVQSNLTGGQIAVDVTGTNVSCFEAEDGSASAHPSGGGGQPYFYEWSNGGTTQTINNLLADTYIVTVTNGAGGMGTGSITITQPDEINTWTGNGDGLSWTDAANWSEGFVPLACQDVVIPAGKTVAVLAGLYATARTIDVALTAILLVDSTATLDVEN